MDIAKCAAGLWLIIIAVTAGAEPARFSEAKIQQIKKEMREKFGEPASLSASRPFTQSASSAKELFVHEGLPHQTWDRALLAAEKQRPDVIELAGFPFYTPATRALKGGELQQLIGNMETLTPFRGEKLCGGFHPDYCLSWTCEKATFYALVCFGCHEIILFDGKTKLRYDINNAAYPKLTAALAPYASKRPRR
jgi:hypothetical protein